MKHKDPYHRQALWPQRSRSVAMSCGASDSVENKKSQNRNAKTGRKVSHTRAIILTSFKVTRQINARVANATRLVWNRSTDVTTVGGIPCPRVRDTACEICVCVLCVCVCVCARASAPAKHWSWSQVRHEEEATIWARVLRFYYVLAVAGFSYEHVASFESRITRLTTS